MQTAQHDHVAQHYAPRADAYVASQVHGAGADLDQIEAALRGQAGARVLDLGCGGGHVSYRGAALVAAVVAVDLTASMLEAVCVEAARRGLRNIETRQAAAEDLPFEDESFDVVLCRFSAHHWQDWQAGLREARRVLKRSGWAMFIDTVAPADRALDTHLQTVELLRDASHMRNERLSDWVASLERAGFSASGVTRRRLRMEFADWTRRTRVTAVQEAAIRSVQTSAPAAVRDYFAIGADGSFDIDTVTMVVEAC